jgi:hypothetical protein
MRLEEVAQLHPGVNIKDPADGLGDCVVTSFSKGARAQLDLYVKMCSRYLQGGRGWWVSIERGFVRTGVDGNI